MRDLLLEHRLAADCFLMLQIPREAFGLLLVRVLHFFFRGRGRRFALQPERPEPGHILVYRICLGTLFRERAFPSRLLSSRVGFPSRLFVISSSSNRVRHLLSHPPSYVFHKLFGDYFGFKVPGHVLHARRSQSSRTFSRVSGLIVVSPIMAVAPLRNNGQAFLARTDLAAV